MSDKQHETQKLHHEGTGIWFLDGRQLTEWIEKPGSLWIEGNSGTGKSVISSTVIRRLLHDRPPSDHGTAAIGYFYFDFRDDKKQLVDTMLRSVVFQLSGQSFNPYAALDAQYGKLSQGQTLPTTQDLLNILDELLLEFCGTYIILDALDECRDTDPPVLIELLLKLQERTEGSLHLLFTSQPREIFTAGFKGVERIVLEPETMQKDVEHFVSDEVLSRLERLKHWDHWKPRAEEIIAKVVAKSNGMFRLATCLIIEVSRPKLEPNLDTILANLPNELYGVYDRFMETIDKDDCVYVERILRWLLFSAEPLTLPMLEDALAFDFSAPHLHVYDPAKRGNKATILCGILEGLVVMAKSLSTSDDMSMVASLAHAEDRIRWGRPSSRELMVDGFCRIVLSTISLMSGSRVVSRELIPADSMPPAHASVADYLVSDKFAACDKWYNLNSKHSHTFLAQTCKQISLNYCILSSRSLRTIPLAKYAAQYWSYHLLCCYDRAALSIPTARLLIEGEILPPPPLYMCSLIGYREGVEYLLLNGADANAVGRRYRNALQAASAKGHTDIIYALLENGADMNMAGGQYGNALQAAAACGHVDVIFALPENGADINEVAGTYRSALEAAAACGHADVICALLENGADINKKTGTYGSALQASAARGHTEVVGILIEKGANINKVGCGYWRTHGGCRYPD
ncbi:hypothetical protein C8J57DRAFT_1570616 [Mycena rebaudengoi]|nr:hypothetical protein C8J57DRAFT_1570616 [Mycena rebaudengoi]